MRTGVLVIGHGSKLEHNRDLAVEMARILDQRGEFGPTVAGFMQLNEPDILEGIRSLMAKGVELIYVQPCFLASGIHITKDIPEVLGLRPESQGGKLAIDGKIIEVKCCRPIGPDPRLADILADRVRERTLGE
jgi:sirohydrochlorin cobalto/nickelchelatase